MARRHRPPHNGTRTSRGAADFIEPYTPTMAERIFNLYVSHPNGLTTFEIEGLDHALHQSASARIHELVAAGCLQPSGIERGTPASAVFVVVPDATFTLYENRLRVVSPRARLWAAAQAFARATPGSTEEAIARETLLNTARETSDEEDTEPANVPLDPNDPFAFD